MGLQFTGREGLKNVVLVVGDLVVTVVLIVMFASRSCLPMFVWFRTVLIVMLLILEVSTLNFVVFFAFLQEYEVAGHHEIQIHAKKHCEVQCLVPRCFDNFLQNLWSYCNASCIASQSI